MSTRTYLVTGMTCSGCAGRVHIAVAGVAGVSEVDVDRATGQVTVTSDRRIDDTLVHTAVVDAGYQVKEQPR